MPVTCVVTSMARTEIRAIDPLLHCHVLIEIDYSYIYSFRRRFNPALVLPVQEKAIIGLKDRKIERKEDG